jgi:hypothetical protein
LLQETYNQVDRAQSKIDKAKFKKIPAEQIQKLEYALARAEFHRDTIIYNIGLI